MYDGGKIIIGLIVGLCLLLSPVIFNLGKAAKTPEPELTDKAKKAGECVAPTPYMRAWHMQLLDKWRHEVVRSGERYYNTSTKSWYVSLDEKLLEGWRKFVTTESEGVKQVTPNKVYYKSLQVTCMDCHANKSKFCDQCHNYLGVTPYCWDCHVEPEEKK